MEAVLIGNVKLTMLDVNAQQRFYLGLLDNIKQFYKDPKNVAEYQEYIANKKAANETFDGTLATKN